jgi:AcrR family transcriptional regulator
MESAQGRVASTDQVRTTRYRSELRTQRAAETRSRIALAARELFAEHGFAGTTVASIAERAGVAIPTVYATYGSKGAIVRALLTQFEADADADGWWVRIEAESDPHRKLVLFAEWSAAIFSSSKAVISAARDAVSDPAIVELRDQADEHRREGLQELLGTIAVRPDLTPDEAVDRAWVLTGLEVYLATTDGCGWSDDAYASWLAEALQQQLLGPANRSNG